MNKVHNYLALEREYISGDMSLRELARRHRISAHSGLVVQAKKGGWAAKREAYRAQKAERMITRLAQGAADREAEVRDAAIEAIDEAITRFRADLRATRPVVLPDGTIGVEPVLQVTAKDVVLLIDRLQVLFGRPAVISEGRGFTASVTSEPLSVEALKQIVELTRGLESPQQGPTSGLPFKGGRRPD